MNRGNGACLNHANQRLQLRRIEFGFRPARPMIFKSIGTVGIEANDPITNDLQPDATGLGGFRSAVPVVNQSER